MNKSASHLLSALVLGLVIPLACSVAYPSTQRVDKQQLLRNAQQKYYNLKRAGLIEFESNVQPNWDVVLGPQSSVHREDPGARSCFLLPGHLRNFLDSAILVPLFSFTGGGGATISTSSPSRGR